MGEWKPISSAPKDGTLVLLFYPTLFGHEQHCLRYWSKGDWGNIKEAWSDQWRQIKIKDQPTHWMPLPEPPALSIEDET